MTSWKLKKIKHTQTLSHEGIRTPTFNSYVANLRKHPKTSTSNFFPLSILYFKKGKTPSQRLWKNPLTGNFNTLFLLFIEVMFEVRNASLWCLYFSTGDKQVFWNCWMLIFRKSLLSCYKRLAWKRNIWERKNSTSDDRFNISKTSSLKKIKLISGHMRLHRERNYMEAIGKADHVAHNYWWGFGNIKMKTRTKNYTNVWHESVVHTHIQLFLFIIRINFCSLFTELDPYLHKNPIPILQRSVCGLCLQCLWIEWLKC